MTNATRNKTRQPPWEGPESEGISFGSWLRQQREVRQITLREIAEASKVSFRYLEAFEQDRFDVLPAAVFTKGFLRQYADYVGLDADEVVNHYLWARREINGEAIEDEAEDRPVPSRASNPRTSSTPVAKERPLWPLLLIAVLLVLVVVTVTLIRSQRERETSPPTPAETFVAPVPPPVPPPPPEPEPEPEVPGAPLRITVEFTRDCWVEAQVDGQRRIAQEFSQGESLQIEAQDRVVFRKLGNAGGVTLEVNGMTLDIGGTDGQVLSDLVIDLDTVAGLEAGQ
ncbi:MAG: helix-turn-helix domain-containing protein [Acidobacteria bacterium]|nr:helix-turn-helix domain-containing protein [Acidobacteriota bacterium]